jgi:hypothetical protein
MAEKNAIASQWEAAVKAATVASLGRADDEVRDAALPIWKAGVHAILVNAKFCPCCNGLKDECLAAQPTERQIDTVQDLLPELALKEFVQAVKDARATIAQAIHGR